MGEVNKVLQEIRPHLMHSAQSNSVCVSERVSKCTLYECVCVSVRSSATFQVIAVFICSQRLNIQNKTTVNELGEG